MLLTKDEEARLAAELEEQIQTRRTALEFLRQLQLDPVIRDNLLKRLHISPLKELLQKLLAKSSDSPNVDIHLKYDENHQLQLAEDRHEEDLWDWTLRLEPVDHESWVEVGRAWSLMLPFIPNEFDRRLVLWGAREWLISTAQAGHDLVWFHKHWLSDEAVDFAEAALKSLDEQYAGANKYGKIDRVRIRKLLSDEFGVGGNLETLKSEMDGIEERFLRLNCWVSDTEPGKHATLLQHEWQKILDARHTSCLSMRSRSGGREQRMPRWWQSALRLLIASDEACMRMGTLVGEYFDVFRLSAARAAVSQYLDETDKEPSHTTFGVETDIERLFGKVDSLAARDPSEPPGPYRSPEARLNAMKTRGFHFAWARVHGETPRLDELRSISFTFSGLTNYDYVCTFPKSRTPSYGNTIRNFTHHLALLPARGVARAALRRGEEKPFRRNPELNILLVPFPFRISASAFKDSGLASGNKQGKKLKWFDLEQDWLDRLTEGHLTTAIDILCQAAGSEVESIDAIIFPEMSLNYFLYAKLALYISRNHPSVELFIAGTSETPSRSKIGARASEEEKAGSTRRNFIRSLGSYLIRLSHLANVGRDELRRGNFVATTTFLRYGNEDVSTYIMTFQQKHHRWRLERDQILRYGLSKNLDPRFDWWENIETSTRNIEFTTFRGGSSLIALVCEDLARLEPCQQLIRAIGPNLVVALLLDGPQKTDRWSARYATVLADDPGSSVLSLTSMGLMPRSTDGHFVDSRCIGLWKDDSGRTQEIHLPIGAHAAVLTLTGERRTELTTDGRDDGSLAIAWHYKGCIPIHDNGLRQELPPEFLGR
jgi:hypothetical protein